MAKTRGCFPRLLLLILIIGVAAAALPLLPISPLKDAVELKLSNTLGRKVTIDSVRLSLITGPYLTLTGMTAQEDAEFGRMCLSKRLRCAPDSTSLSRCELVKSFSIR
jgi:hypothetical protein